MRLKLEDIKGGVLEQYYSCLIADFPDLSDTQKGKDHFLDPLMFHLRFQRSGQMVELDGRVEARLELTCGRCLKTFERTVSDSFSLTFTPESESSEAGDEDVELEADELGLIVYQDDVLDLTGPLQDQLVMLVPISPVCQDACAGLCTECGADLSQEQCSCEKKPFNNKFSALADLKLKS